MYVYEEYRQILDTVLVLKAKLAVLKLHSWLLISHKKLYWHIWPNQLAVSQIKTNFIFTFASLTENIDDQIEEERKRAEELKTEVREWERKNKDQNKNMGGVHMSAQHHVQTLKNIRKLENSLQLVSIDNQVNMTYNRNFADKSKYLVSKKGIRYLQIGHLQNIRLYIYFTCVC